jgi:hydrogenase-1 operon protein HyaE
VNAAQPPITDAPPALHPLLRRLVAETGAAMLDPASFDDWAAQAGAAMAVFAEEPERQKETLDLAVVVPELHAARRGAFRVGLLPPPAARALAARYGFARWPAFVMLRDGCYLGAVDGIRDWDVYIAELDRLLAAEPSRPPSIGIAVRGAGAAGTPTCS